MNGLRAVAAAVFGVATIPGAGQAMSSPMTLHVDLTDAPRKLIHATQTMTVTPGDLTLVYPKWIPGEHAPDGPIDNQAGLVFTCGGAEGTRVDWRRDRLEMFAYHLTVPAGCMTLTIRQDFLATAPATGFSAGASTSENLALLSWNTTVMYPDGMNAADVRVTPSLTVPSAWQFGTALRKTNTPAGEAATYTANFETVSLESLVDSPVLAGKYFKEIPLAPEVTPKHYLDIAADGPEELELPPARIENFSRLVRETGALYQSRHYREYHFLVTLSDSVAHFGLEHHESSDDRIPGKTFIENERFVLAADLLPHEFTHSWNGKYRRPAGLATPNYQKPMQDDLLWVYEGLTQYFGDVLAARSGLMTPEQFRSFLANTAANADNRPGRSWRNLQDTADMAQVLYFAGGGWDNWRRSTDFYAEGELIWLDADVTIRRLTNNKKSLNDFAAAFEGVGGNTTPNVVPYTFEDVVTALNSVVAYDWAKFLRDRLDSRGPRAPLGGIENGGYKLAYSSMPGPWQDLHILVDETPDFWYSIGLRLKATGDITDVLKDGVADKAGAGPGMKLIAVNSRAFTPAALRQALKETADGGPALELILQNSGYFRVVKLDYHGGERYPELDRVNGTPALLDDIIAPMVK
jgi:predicted metalloprotease with PDZ domain